VNAASILSVFSLRNIVADDPTMLPHFIGRDMKLVRNAVDSLYREHRSGRDVATKIGIDFRTLKRWLLRFEEAGIPIPQGSKGSYEDRDAKRSKACLPLRNVGKPRQKKKRLKKG
jgi:hypothetical protein